MKRMWLVTIAFVVAVRLCAADGRPVTTRMRNVIFNLGHGISLRVDEISGQLVSTSPEKPPVFDDVSAYAVSIESGRTSMSPESLTNLMNNYVFAYADAPLKNLRITIEGNELRQSGTLKKGIGVPFDMRATIAASPDGRIVIHPVSMKAAGFVPKGVLDFFGLELERLITLKQTPAVKIVDDDFILDPERILPPPRIRGTLTRAWIENGAVFQQFGPAGERPRLAPSDARVKNYMYYRGGVLKFGKLTMEDTDLLLVDANQKDPFDFSPAEYNRQLVAGYSKNTPSHGLVVYMPDLSELNARKPRNRVIE